jgi:hypothetical protein
MTRGVPLISIVIIASVAVLVLLGIRATSAPKHPEVREALDRASEFLLQRRENLDPTTIAVLADILRDFRVPVIAAIVDSEKERACTGLRQRGSGPFCRLLWPSHRASTREIAAMTPIDQMTGRALHCGELGVDAAYETRIEVAISEGEYGLTHAAIALHWIARNGCEHGPQWRTYRAKAAEGLASCVERVGSQTDLGIEAVVALFLLERGDLVQKGWIENMLLAQRADGGWGAKPHKSSWDHTTFLAMWVMLHVEAGASASE